MEEDVRIPSIIGSNSVLGELTINLVQRLNWLQNGGVVRTWLKTNDVEAGERERVPSLVVLH